MEKRAHRQTVSNTFNGSPYQPCTYTLASIVQRKAGMPLTRYLRPRLFDPLGIGEAGWRSFSPGREQGYTGLHARTEDVAKLGQLYLQRGCWDGPS